MMTKLLRVTCRHIVHLRSLIRIFAVRRNILGTHGYTRREIDGPYQVVQTQNCYVS